MAISRFRTTVTPDTGLDQAFPIAQAAGARGSLDNPSPSPTVPPGTFPVNTRGSLTTPSPSPIVPPGTFPVGGRGSLDTASPSPTVPPGTFPIPGTTPVPVPPAPPVNSQPQQPPGVQFSPYRVTTDNLNALLGSESPYIQNARRRGLEQANSRGMLNSSIAAGASERSAIEASMPILNQIMGLTGQREQQANTSLENQRSRQFEADMFDRNFNAQLAMLPIASAADMWSGLMQLAASDPTVFTPTVLAGYQDFFQTGFNEYISRYLRPGGG